MELIDHIGIFENAVPKETCDKLIELFELTSKMSYTHSREQSKTFVNDEQLFVTFDYQQDILITLDNYNFRKAMDIVMDCYDDYMVEYPLLKELQHHTFFQGKIQKTKKSQGFHRWHFERGSRDVFYRMVVYMIYLNDVEDGGETEFLYQSKRIKPKTGTVVLFPATYTHTHRGNPPLTCNKYIVTGWVEFRGSDV